MIHTKCRQDPYCWHKWYAWRPVCITQYTKDRICKTWVWRETVWRQLYMGLYDYSLTKPVVEVTYV